jgi:hypothetical protein
MAAISDSYAIAGPSQPLLEQRAGLQVFFVDHDGLGFGHGRMVPMRRRTSMSGSLRLKFN